VCSQADAKMSLHAGSAPDREGIQTRIYQLAKTRPQMKNLNPGGFIDLSNFKEIEDNGFIKKLYGNWSTVRQE
jgi:hypothetical protein